jgi:hypothetical protein
MSQLFALVVDTLRLLSVVDLAKRLVRLKQLYIAKRLREGNYHTTVRSVLNQSFRCNAKSAKRTVLYHKS